MTILIDGDRLPELDAGELRLRWLEERDVPALFAIFSSAEVTRYWSTPAYTEEEQAAELLRSIHAQFEARKLFQWGIVRRDVDRVVGTSTLAALDPQNRRAEIGFALGCEHWGQGLARRATRRLIEFAFEDVGLHRLEADVDPRNDASIRLLEAHGFEREGYLRERWIVDGEINDTVLLGLLARDWKNRQDS